MQTPPPGVLGKDNFSSERFLPFVSSKNKPVCMLDISSPLWIVLNNLAVHHSVAR